MKRTVNRCALGLTCFYIQKQLTLPDDMFGAKSATFIVGKAVALQEQPQSHNGYLYEADL